MKKRLLSILLTLCMLLTLLPTTALAATTLPTALDYGQSAVSGTDYVRNDTDKTLAIKTDKGLAWLYYYPVINYKITLEASVDVSTFQWIPVGDPQRYGMEGSLTGTFDGQGHTISGLTKPLFHKVGSGGTVKNLTVSGTIADAGIEVGGITRVNEGIIDNCINKASVTADMGAYWHGAGGIAGINKGTIRNCGNTGTVYTFGFRVSAGGIAGILDGNSTNINVTNCWNAGTITETHSGGDPISNPPSGGTAGIVGYNYGCTVTNCYNIGSADKACDGNVDYASTGTVTNCYYLTSANTGFTGMKYTISGCGTFTDNGGSLTAGTAANAGSAQTLNYGTTLLDALNGWVNAQADKANYREWKAVTNGYPVFDTCTVTFNANGGTGSMGEQFVPQNIEGKLSGNSFTRTGYAFNGWNTASNGSGTSYVDQASVTLTANTPLYAQWEDNSYTVTVNVDPAGYGSVSPTSVSGVLDGTQLSVNGNKLTVGSTVVTASPASRTEGYSYYFVGWTNGTSTVDGNKTVTANFKRVSRIAKPTVNNATFNYTGNEQAYTPTGFNSSTMNITGNKRTVAGSQNVTITPKDGYEWYEGSDDPTFTFTIGQATNQVTSAVTITGWTYGSTKNEPIANFKFGEPTYTYSTAENGTYSGTVPTNVGTYWVKASVVATASYTAAESKVSFTISPSAVTNTPKNEEITYSGTYDVSNLFTTGTGAGTASYEIASGGTGEGTLSGSNLTITKAGSFKIRMTTAAAGNYAAGEAVTATLMVNKATVDIPNAGSKAYTGSTLVSDLTTNGYYTVTENAGGIDVDEYEVVLALVNNNLYKWATGEDTPTRTVKFNIAQATNGVTSAVTITDWTYGETANMPTAAAFLFGGDTAAYTYSDAENGTYTSAVPTVAGDYWVKASVDVTDNYTAAESKASFTIGNATLANVSVEQTGTLIYTGEAQTATVSAGAASVNEQTVTFTYCTTQGGTYGAAVPEFTAAGEHTVYFKANAANHNTYSGSFTVTISNAPQVTPMEGEGFTINYASEVITYNETIYEVYTAAEGGTLVASGSSFVDYLAGDLYIRLKAKDNYDASNFAAIDLPERDPEPASLAEALDIDYIGERISAKAGYEFSFDNGSTWMTGTISAIPETSVSVRKKAITALGSESIASEILTANLDTRPAATSAAINGAAELISTTAVMEYKTGFGTWTPCTADMALSAFGWSGSAAVTVEFRIAATETAYHGDAQSISIPARAPAPSAGLTNETWSGQNNGTITSVNSTMEYQLYGADAWTAITGNTITGLADGVYYLRFKAVGPGICSEQQMLTIAPGRTIEVVFDEQGGTEVDDYTGKVWHDTVTPPTTTRTGYTFGGWFTEIEDGTKLTASTPLEGDATYHARWTANNYTVVFDSNGGEGDMADMVLTYDAEAVALNVNTFAREDYRFSGWNTAADGTGVAYSNEQGVRNLTATANAEFTLYAQWTELSRYNVGGSVTNDGTTPIEGAAVQLKRGDKVIAQTATAADGSYQFTNIAVGSYNIVAAKEKNTATILVAVTDGDITDADLTLTVSNKSSVLEISGEDTPDVLVGGLNTLAEADSDDNIVIKLKVESKEADRTNEDQAAIKQVEGASGKTQKFMDITLTRTVGAGTPANIGTTNNHVLEIIIPFQTSGRLSITAYRYHNDSAAALTKLDTRPSSSYTDGTYFVGDGFVVIYAKAFSLYSIGYTVPYYAPTYPPVVTKAEHGTVSISPRYPEQGDTVTISTVPDEGFEVGTVTVIDGNGSAVKLTKNENGTYTYTQPYGSVTITVTFNKAGACDGGESCPAYKFSDLDLKLWYHDGIHYCVENGMMEGIPGNLFDPYGTTSRAQIVTILWRLEGKPVINYLMRFEDVAEDQWYSEAIRWAASEKIVEGYGATFGAGDAVTREQLATILWRYAKYKGMDVSVGENTNILSYKDALDVSEWAIHAMQWACGAGIIQGSDGYLMPDGTAKRCEAAAMLQRYCELPEN